MFKDGCLENPSIIVHSSFLNGGSRKLHTITEPLIAPGGLVDTIIVSICVSVSEWDCDCRALWAITKVLKKVCCYKLYCI